jgi:hypothetical protein
MYARQMLVENNILIIFDGNYRRRKDVSSFIFDVFDSKNRVVHTEETLKNNFDK